MSEYEKILARGANLCSANEKCQHEMKEKFLLWGLSEEEAERGLSYLIKNKFVDDSRYANYFVKDKLNINKWGRIKISFALRKKKISSEIIESSLEKINADQYNDILDHLLKSKISSIGNIKTASNKAKLFRFAAQRGFTSEEIYGALRRITI